MHWRKDRREGEEGRPPLFEASGERGREGEREEGEWAGRARTASKYCVSTPFVEDGNLHHSVIEELQSLDYPPVNTEHFIRTKGTLDELRIRKSSSFDRDKVELSLSSEYIDLETENHQLRKRLEEMDRQVRNFIEVEQTVRLELVKQKREIEEYEAKLERKENELGRVGRRLRECETGLQDKEQEITELWGKLEEAGKYIAEANAKLTQNQRNNEEARNKFYHEKQSLAQQYQQQLNQQQTFYQSHLHALQTQFSLAKQTGQSQIDSLLALLQQRQALLQLKTSTHITSNPSRSKLSKPPKQEPRFMDRYLSFARMIDRRLHASEGKSSKLFQSSEAGQSACGNGEMAKFLGRFQEKRSQYLPRTIF